jgi:hypothetical protein
LNPSLHTLLTPADGLEPKSELFTESPIEALDWLKELGEIARVSIEPPALPTPLDDAENEVAAPALETAPLSASAPPAQAPVEETPSDESRLTEALLEYHRLRNPAVASRTKGKFGAEGTRFSRAEGSSAPTSHFAPMDIPVVKNASPKPAGNAGRTAQPMHSILQPKKRS